jgi:hypothetical protein
MSSAFGWIAHITFWVVLVIGWMTDEIAPAWAALLIVIWLLGSFSGLNLYVPFTSLLALLDIVLVFIVFGGDVQLR